MKEKKKKERLDVLLVKRGLAESREKAKAIIMTGNVFVEEQREDKAGSMFAEDAQIRIKGTPMKRVVSMEKTNIRYVTPEDIADPIDFSSIDVAFISLTKVLIPVWNLLKNGGRVVCLVKPQFEAGREKVGKKGVVRDKKVHEEVVCHIMTYALSMGFEILGLSYSPIKGPEGNIEYLLYIEKPQDAQALTEIAEEADQKAEEQFEQQYLALAKETVEAAHEAFLYHHE